MTWNPPDTRGGYAVSQVGIAGLSQFVLPTTLIVSTIALPLPATPAVFRKTLGIFNNDDADTLYVGGGPPQLTPTVTALTGFPILPLSYLFLDVSDDVWVYGITASGLVEVRVLEGG